MIVWTSPGRMRQGGRNACSLETGVGHRKDAMFNDGRFIDMIALNQRRSEFMLRSGPYNPAAQDVTKVLDRLSCGDPDAADQLLPVVYEELRNLAGHLFRSQASDQTLQPTALVHEAYIRLVEGPQRGWKDRAHFFAVAARAMRQILVNHALARQTAKRGGQKRKVPLDMSLNASEVKDDFLLALDEALEKLATIDELRSRIVELRFFGGLTISETATVLGTSPSSIDRGWNFAKGWLHREITRGD